MRYKDIINRKTVRKYTVFAALIWTTFVSAVLLWNIYHHKVVTLEIARNQAQLSYEKDIVYRRWAAKHGGVYVPVTEETPPNPYLSHIKERDITTPSGRKLTLMNPAYMTRQVHKIGAEQYGLRGHITSLNPIRPENAPDAWERKMLEGFTKNPVGVTSLEEIDGQPYMRFMKPLFTEQACLKCHPSQGYKQGDIRGGLSVSVPMKPLWAITNANLKKLVLGYAAIWFSGLIGIITASQHIQNQVERHNQAEESRKKSEKKYRALFESSMDAIMTLAPPEWKFTSGNPAAIRMFGAESEEEFKTCSPWELSPEYQPDGQLSSVKARNMIEKAMQTGSNYFEWSHRKLQGDVFPATVLLSKTELGDKTFLQATVRDISKLKDAEEQRDKILKELEKVNSELKEFAYVISHDLKTPLRGIKTLSDWFMSDYGDKVDENGKEQLRLLSSRVDRMHNLIDAVLQYSRIGRTEGAPEEVDLNEVVAETIDLVAAPQNITITVEDNLPKVLCDKIRIGQVFQNLLSNAIKFMDKPQGWIKIRCEEQGDFWQFSVADNGPGIEEQHFERIFKIFQTLSSKNSYESTGIGLTLVKKIVELYGGRVWVESKVGQGSTFFFTLPKQTQGAVTNEQFQTDIAYRR